MARSGFTLVEVMMAMLIGLMVVSLAAATFSTVTDSVVRLRGVGLEWTRAENARVWIAEALSNAVVNPDAAPFLGTPVSLDLHTRVWVEGGWLEPASVGVAFQDDALTGHVDGRERMRLTGFEHGRIEYLVSIGERTLWESAWRSDLSMPLAVRMTFRRGARADTLLFWTGGR